MAHASAHVDVEFESSFFFLFFFVTQSERLVEPVDPLVLSSRRPFRKSYYAGSVRAWRRNLSAREAQGTRHLATLSNNHEKRSLFSQIPVKQGNPSGPKFASYGEGRPIKPDRPIVLPRLRES